MKLTEETEKVGSVNTFIRKHNMEVLIEEAKKRFEKFKIGLGNLIQKPLGIRTNEQKDRAMAIYDEYNKGTEFVINGALSFSGACELDSGFHRIPKFDGEICETGFLSRTETVAEDLYKRMQKTKRPIIVLEKGLIYKTTPEMTVQEINDLSNEKWRKKIKFFEEKREKEVDFMEQVDKRYQKITIINQDLWEQKIQENLVAPKTDFIPKEFNRDSEIRITALRRYAAILEGERQKNGKITPEAIRYADDLANLSFDLRKSLENEETIPEIRFEGCRFWADVVLARTWKYGKELLEVEGFSQNEVESIQTDTHIPTNYTYYENLSHPLIEDKRVLALGRELLSMGPKNLEVYIYKQSMLETLPDPRLRMFKSQELERIKNTFISQWAADRQTKKVVSHENNHPIIDIKANVRS